MLDPKSNPGPSYLSRAFYVGLAIVLLANMFGPSWYTFVHMWRVEIAASIFLGSTLIYLLWNNKRFSFRNEIYSDEWMLIVLPIVAFIIWGALSALWAPSWKSALHHSLIWAEYLIFYLIFRQMLERGSSFGKLLAVFVLTLVFYAIPAVVEYCAYLSFGGPTTLGMRFGKFGEQVVTILPLVLLGVIRMRGKKFVIGSAAVALMWLLIFCSFGRVNYALFGFAIAGIFAALIISKQNRRYVPKFAILTTILILAPLPLHIFSLSSPAETIPIVSRLSDAEGMDSSNNFRKLMFSVSGEMIRGNPLIGIGADNFGMQVNRYREAYGAANPTDVNLANAEDEMPSHAHNEFLQIVAELGIVGGVIFAWLLAGIGVMAYRTVRDMRSGSLYGFAAVLGIAMYLASSLVSSYSFRVMQNGIVFFFVLAVAAKLTFKRDPSAADREVAAVSPSHIKLALASGILACVGLLVYSGVRVSSVIIALRANQTRNFQRAMPLYDLAMRLDDENPDARQNLGMRLFRNRRYKEAVPYLQSAISIGRAPSAEMSYLATAKSLAGDDQGAEETMASAASLYARSPFVLTRYATILEKNGKGTKADDVFNRAVEIDQSSARTWRTLIVSGPKALSDLAARDPAYLPVMDLRPKSSIYAVVTERLIRFPEDRKFSFAKLPEVEE